MQKNWWYFCSKARVTLVLMLHILSIFFINFDKILWCYETTSPKEYSDVKFFIIRLIFSRLSSLWEKTKVRAINEQKLAPVIF